MLSPREVIGTCARNGGKLSGFNNKELLDAFIYAKKYQQEVDTLELSSQYKFEGKTFDEWKHILALEIQSRHNQQTQQPLKICNQPTT